MSDNGNGEGPIKFTDKRAGSAARKAQQRADELRDAAEEGRPAKKSGTFNDFFSFENQKKFVDRGDLLGFMEMLEWHRRQWRWWRVLWRVITRQPHPWPLASKLAYAFQKKTIDPQVELVKQGLERDARKQSEEFAERAQRDEGGL